jgi:hypothetical protein
MSSKPKCPYSGGTLWSEESIARGCCLKCFKEGRGSSAKSSSQKISVVGAGKETPAADEVKANLTKMIKEGTLNREDVNEKLGFEYFKKDGVDFEGLKAHKDYNAIKKIQEDEAFAQIAQAHRNVIEKNNPEVASFLSQTFWEGVNQVLAVAAFFFGLKFLAVQGSKQVAVVVGAGAAFAHATPPVTYAILVTGFGYLLFKKALSY